MSRKLKWGLAVVLCCLVESIACADSLELKNGSLIEGKFIGGTESEISFQVASSVQKYNVADIVSVKFGAERTEDDLASREHDSLPNKPEPETRVERKIPEPVTIPA